MICAVTDIQVAFCWDFGGGLWVPRTSSPSSTKAVAGRVETLSQELLSGVFRGARQTPALGALSPCLRRDGGEGHQALWRAWSAPSDRDPSPSQEGPGRRGSRGRPRCAWRGSGQGRAFPRARPARSVTKNPPFLPLGTSSTLQTQPGVGSVERCDSRHFGSWRSSQVNGEVPLNADFLPTPRCPALLHTGHPAGRRTPSEACPNQGPAGSEPPGKAKHLNGGTGPGWGAGSG